MCSALSQTAFGIESASSGVVARLFEIHDRIGAVDSFERKSVRQFRKAHLLAIVFRRPAQQAEKIDERLGQKSGIAVGGNAHDRAVTALGKLGAVGRHQQRKMRELRRLETGGFENQYMFVRIRQMVLAANDVADAQVGVVGARGQVIGRHAVGAQQGEVFDVGAGLHLLAVNRVGKAHRPVRLRAARESAGQTALRRRRGGRSLRAKVHACRD